jgi:hypothetical protein
MNRDLKVFLARWDVVQDGEGSIERSPSRLKKDIDPHLAHGVHLLTL